MRKIFMMVLMLFMIVFCGGCNLDPYFIKDGIIVDKKEETHTEFDYDDTHYYFYLRKISSGDAADYKWEVYKEIYDKYQINDHVDTRDFEDY